MATNFPTSLDNFTNPVSGNTLDSPSHSLQHSDANDAIEAIEAKLGIGNSPAGSATSGYVLTAGTGGTTTWSALPAAGGLVPIVPSSVTVGSGSASVSATGKITFTGASSISVNDVFSSSYDKYKVIVRVTSGSATSVLRYRFRVSGADDSNNVYRYAGYYAGLETASSGFVTNSVSTSWQIGYYLNGAYPSYTIMEINQPNEAAQKNAIIHDIANEGAWFGTNYMNVFTNSTSFTGFTVYGASGNSTGSIAVFGYRI